ncbi:hypothetical protein T265_07094 [Opisthorchis viverrini]|uniref:Uncharacterized protein n=1 Tax=Opisthorchis viverrini TaxID=6198 RepID=A0A075ACJ7_OPIVI|nr:hypothetical protein T265_07094 [Opisthorchis viverrini]KER25474.1 hypothetical protein T265_07094 [Opisthorchis viverrini]
MDVVHLPVTKRLDLTVRLGFEPKALVEDPNRPPVYVWAPWQYPSPPKTMNCTYTNKLMPHRPSRGAISRVKVGSKMAQWIEREFNNRKVYDSEPTSASRLSLSRFRKPGSIPALVLTLVCMTARH